MHKVGTHFVADMRPLSVRRRTVVGVEREEFDEACARLERAGYQLHSPDKAWADFSMLRSKYGAWLNQTTKGLGVPPAPWIGDRSYLPHRERAPLGPGQRRVA